MASLSLEALRYDTALSGDPKVWLHSHWRFERYDTALNGDPKVCHFSQSGS